MPVKPLGKQHNAMLTELQGQIERIAFTIAKVKVSGRQDLAFSTA
jgi:hypothetical protein